MKIKKILDKKLIQDIRRVEDEQKECRYLNVIQ